MTHPNTSEQDLILSAARDTKNSLMISAYAGCGKTSTLELVANALPPQPSLALAFNVKIKKELEKRFPPHFKVMTLNGLGHTAWAKAIGRQPAVDEKKLGNIITKLGKEHQLDLGDDKWNSVRELVSAAMHSGLVPSKFPAKGLLGDTEEIWKSIAQDHYIELAPAYFTLARACLIESILLSFPTEGNSPVISFDDQIYLSTMLGGVFPKYPLVLVDEAQDLSPLNHIQLKKVAGDRLVVCGDPKQAIYGFRGADAESMGKIRSLRSNWSDLSLTLTFRCPKVIVERQQGHAPGFRAFHTNAEGLLVDFYRKEEKEWSWRDIQGLSHGPRATFAVLCRNNAPILALAFKLLRQGVGCYMLGRDIGKGLIALSKKILPQDDIPALEARVLVQNWMERESALAQANDKPEKVAGITDRGECLLAVVDHANDSGELRAKLKDLFSKDAGQVTLSSGHRAKGLEWDLVIHLDPWRIPSRYAKHNPKAMEQELNLQYVIETRAKRTLVLANLGDFQ